MSLIQMKHTAKDYCDALDKHERISAYLAAQYRHTMSHPEAQAHFDARALLLNIRNAVLSEAEAIWEPKHG